MNQTRILTVEDDPIVRADLRAILEDAGFAVVPDARDGEEALARAREHAPDLILMDLGLPGLEEGLGATSRILRERDVPIVALSGHGGPEVLKRAEDAGVGGYVLKPFDESSLIATIRAALVRRRRELERDASDYQLRALVESMVRENADERAIERAVRRADLAVAADDPRPATGGLLRRLLGS